MEVLRGVAVGPVVEAFFGVGALDRLGLHTFIVPGKTSEETDPYRCAAGVEQWRYETRPELGFDDDGRPVLITRAAPAFEVQHRERVRKYVI